MSRDFFPVLFESSGLRTLWFLSLALIAVTPCLAGGNPVDGAATPEERQLMVIHGANHTDDRGDFVSSATGLDTHYSFGIEVPIGAQRLQIELFDPDVGAGPAATEASDERDFVSGVADSAVHYLLLDPAGQPVPVRFGIGDSTGPADNAWTLLYDSETAEAIGEATFADTFDSRSYGNDDSPMAWASDWIESNEEVGGTGPTTGLIQITPAGQLRLTRRGSVAPTIERTVDLSGLPRRVLRFDWSTEGDLEDDDTFVVEASHDGGATWLGLGLISGASLPPNGGSVGSHAVFDLAADSAQVVIRFRPIGFTDAGEAILIDNVEIRTTAPTLATAPQPGHWRLFVDMSTAASPPSGQQDDRNAFAIRAHDGDPGAGGTEIDVYSETYLPIGVNQAAAGRTYQVHPYVTNGCLFRFNDFDFDSDQLIDPGSWTATTRFGHTQGTSSGYISTDGSWLSRRLPSAQYGASNLSATIKPDTPGNVATLYLGDFQSADSDANGDGTPGPTASPESGAIRLYLPTDADAAPSKPFLVQTAGVISGPLQPVVGMTTRFVIILRLGHPSTAQGPLIFDPGQAVRVSFPGENTDADVCFAGVLPTSPRLGTLDPVAIDCGGTLVWNPGQFDPGTTADLIYFVDVTPKESTWTAILSGDLGTPLGTHAVFRDATGTESRLGDICPIELSYDTPSTIPLSNLAVTRTPIPADLEVDEGETIRFDVDVVFSASPGSFMRLDTLFDGMTDLDGEGTCISEPPPFLSDQEPTYSCTYQVTPQPGTVTSVLTAGGSYAGIAAQDTQTYTVNDVPPTFDVSLTADPTSVCSGETVTFTLEVTNTSAFDPLEMIELSDTLSGDFPDCQVPQGGVHPGDDPWTCEFERTIHGDFGDVVEVTVEVTATDDDGTPAVVEDTVTLTLKDQEPPTVSFVDPPVDSLWLLSPPEGHSEGPNTRAITLETSDNDRVCQIELRLRTDQGASNPSDPQTWGLPTADNLDITDGSVPCDSPGLADDGTWTRLVEVPRIHPAGHPNARYVLEAIVTDASGNSNSALTGAFEIDQRDEGDVRTLLLTHRGRLPGTPEGLDDLEIALWDFANHSKVEGVLLDLALVPGLQELYDTWDTEASNNPLASYNQANALLLGPGGIRDLVLELRERYQNLLFLQIVGDDRVVPFARLTNDAVSHPETHYVHPFLGDLRGPDSTVAHALGADKFLSDDPLATFAETPAGGILASCKRPWSPPDFGIGRLVETPTEIQVAIQGFLDRGGLLDLEAAPEKMIQIAGYDFLREAANDARKIWSNALDLPPFYNDLSPLDKMLIFPGNWGLDSIEERSEALLTHLTGNGGDSYGIVQLYGHATHFQEGVPAESPTSIEGLDAACLYDPSNIDCLFAPRQPLDLEGSFVYSTGCHSGLTVPGSTPFDLDNSLDLAQTYLSRGALGYLASTGYSFGVTPGIGLIERFGLHLNDRLTKIPESSLRDLVIGTKRAYFGEDHCFNGYDLKTLQQLVLYGFPMAVIRTGLGGAEDLGPRLVVLDPEGDGPPHLHRSTVTENFNSGEFVKFDSNGLEHPEAGCEDPEGCYYTYVGRRSSEVSDLPIQPYAVFLAAIPDFKFRGILWKGGTYVEEPGWRAARTLFSTNDDPTDAGRLEGAPRHVLLGPVGRSLELGPSDQAEGLFAEEEVTLLFTLGESIRNFDDDPDAIFYNRQRLYQKVDIETFWYNSLTGPLLDDEEGPEFLSVPGNRYHSWDTANPGTLKFEVPVQDPDNSDADSEPQDVWRVVVVYNDGSLGGDSGLEGSWQSLELEPNGGSDGRLFVGDLTFDGGKQLTYVLQAIDFQGNISWLRWTTTSIPETGLVPEIPLPVDIDPELHIEVAASPDQLDETGGSTMISVTIQNVGGAEVVLDVLSSTLRGQTPEENDLVEVCGLPQALSIGGEPFVCEYQLTISSEPGTVTETVRARGTASDDRPVPDASELVGSVEIEIRDVPPMFGLSVDPESPSIDEPGGTVDLTLTLTNTGPEQLTLTSLTADAPESLSEDCSLAIDPGTSDSCPIGLEVSGNGGEIVRRTLYAGMSDNEGNQVVLSIEVDVLIRDLVPSILLALETADGSPNMGGIDIDESSGMVTLDLTLTNNSVEDILEITLSDDTLGDLSVVPDCDPIPPETLARDAQPFSCSFDRDLVGQADRGDQMTVTVEAEVSDDEENEVTEDESLTFNLVGVDWGDAPTSFEIEGDEARHTILAGFFLGSGVDAETGSQASVEADGDDGNRRDDEDGVTFPPLVPGGDPVDIELDVSLDGHPGVLDAWIDWNADGEWDNSGERYSIAVLNEGVNTLSVAVPDTATPGGEIYARFRLSTLGVEGPSGAADDGEVEDYRLMLEDPRIQVDFAAIPSELPETRGDFLFQLTLENKGTVDLEIDLELNPPAESLPTGCPASLTLTTGAPPEPVCTFPETLEGDAGTTLSHTFRVTATALGAPLPVEEETATATLVNSDPELEASLSGPPGGVDELEDEVTLTLLATNTAGREELLDLTLTFDDGSDDLVLPCVTPIEGENWQCQYTFQREVSGQADQGAMFDFAATVSVTDNEGSPPAMDEVSLTIPITGIDWGDAPASYEVPEDEAQHTIVAGFFLGAGVDSDASNQPGDGADGDDTVSMDTRDDEDGVTFPPLVPGGIADIQITASLDGRPGVLDAWIDWNADGEWDNTPTSDERYSIAALNEGINTLSVAIPDTVTPGVESFARFRLSTTGVAGPSGAAIDGEVEDYRLMLEDPRIQVDFVVTPSELPETEGEFQFQLTLENEGTVDLEIDLELLTSDTLDDHCPGSLVLATGAPPEPVCSFADNLSGNAGATLSHTFRVTSTALGAPLPVEEPTAQATLVNVDPQLDAVLQDPPAGVDELEQEVSLTLLATNTAGSEALVDLILTPDDGSGDIALPCLDPTEGEFWQCTYEFTRDVIGQADQGAMFTFNATASVTDDEGSPRAMDSVSLTIPITGIDWGDAPASYEPAGDAARHTIAAGFYLGAGVDSDASNQPSDGADGDDTASMDTRDDEDGVTFLGDLIPGQNAMVEIEASLGGQPEAFLDAWIDWNEDGDWNDPDERIFDGEPLTEGLQTLTVAVPADAPQGMETIARFRLSSSGVGGPGGLAADGEVEDHAVGILDITPPAITELTLEPGGPLADCLSTGAPPVALTLVFSEPMADPAGDDDPNDVTNPTNYRLLAAGPDREFQTFDCGGAVGDDQEMPLAQVTYELGTTSATLQLAGGQALGSDLYRFVACDALTDPTGNPLDGDGDTAAGGVLVRTFRVDAFNLLGDPHFDCDLGVWDVMPTGEITYGTDDHQDSADSGSARIDDTIANPVDYSLGQCVQLPENQDLVMRSSLRLLLPIGTSLDLVHLCMLYGDPLCETDPPLGTREGVFAVGDTDGAWVLQESVVDDLSGAASAWCTFVLRVGALPDPEANLDALYLGPVEPIVFVDGFESGDTAEWSSTMP